VTWAAVFIPTFLASAVEVIEMAIIVIGVGATRGWRSTFLGAGGGFLALGVLVAGLGKALTVVPIGALRVAVGGLLLVFGLQWLRKGVRRVSANGFAGFRGTVQVDEPDVAAHGVDWTAFVLAFKGVLLEGLEVAFIAVSFGATAGTYSPAIVGAVSAVLVIGAVAAAAESLVRRIPRSALQLIVGTLLTSFGTFWGAEGLGVRWPGEDAAILGLIAVYVAFAALSTALLRRHAPLVAARASS
jgi:uncharacterized membrane protein